MNYWDFDETKGFVVTGNTTIGLSGCPTPDGYWTIDSTAYRGGTVIYSCNYGFGGSEGSSHTSSEYSVTAVEQTNESESCGSYIDKVTSTSRYTYPDNSNSGSYWYIYQGTSTSQ